MAVQRSGQRPVEQLAQLGFVQALQHIDRGPRQQRGIDFEGRVLGGGADEGHRAALDVGQEGILLRLVEAMHLVDEQDGAPPLLRHHLGLLHRLADVLDAGKHRRQRDEFGIEAVGHQPRQRGLADARRAPEDHRMRRAGREGQAQRLALADQVALADHLVERARPHLLGQRRMRRRWRTGQSPTTSAPAGARSGTGSPARRIGLELGEAQVPSPGRSCRGFPCSPGGWRQSRS
jgi:hypothetical protein